MQEPPALQPRAVSFCAANTGRRETRPWRVVHIPTKKAVACCESEAQARRIARTLNGE